MSITPRVDMIGLTVADIPRSLAFYRLLGLKVDDPEEGRPYVEASLPGGIRLSWNAESLMKTLHPDWQAPRGQSMNLAFHCETPAGVDETYAALVEAGHRGVKPPWDAFWGQRYALVADPDGHTVDLFAPSS